MKLYISGPMKGYPEHNFPAFNAAANHLRSLGFEVVNPAEINPGPAPEEDDSPTWQAFYHACLRADIRALMDCEGIILIPGWEHSSGANLELHIAHRVGITPYVYSAFLASHTQNPVHPDRTDASPSNDSGRGAGGEGG